MELIASHDRRALVAGVDMIVAGLAMVQGSSADELTHPELVAQMDRLKSVVWALPAVEHRLLARLVAEADPKVLGATSLADVLATGCGSSRPKRAGASNMPNCSDRGRRSPENRCHPRCPMSPPHNSAVISAPSTSRSSSGSSTSCRPMLTIRPARPIWPVSPQDWARGRPR